MREKVAKGLNPRERVSDDVRFEDVTKRYRDGSVAVDSLSLECPAGQITVFVGPSVCGKTTSLRMINHMIAPTQGQKKNAADVAKSWRSGKGLK